MPFVWLPLIERMGCLKDDLGFMVLPSPLPRLAVINNCAKQYVDNMVEFGGFWLTQDAVAFPPHLRAFCGPAIIDNFDVHMEL